VSDSRRHIGEKRHTQPRSCNHGLGRGILSSAAGTGAGGDPIAQVTSAETAPSLSRWGSAEWLLTRDSIGSGRLERMRVGVCVESEWAGRAVSRALRDAGAAVIHLDPMITPEDLVGSAALVYDLNPWTETAAQRFSGLVRGLMGGPILLYLPPSGPAFTTFSQLPKAGDIRVQVQSRDVDSMAHLRNAAVSLIRAVPRTWIMDRLQCAVPGLSSAAYLFGHRALGVLASGRRPSVAALSRALGLSQRTLQRRFRADGLPGPKALLDWLTLTFLWYVAHLQQRSVARAAADLELAANDLYRLRKRVRRHTEHIGGKQLTDQAPGALIARGPDARVATSVS
jgi:AraC-like DNA-binding protein